MADKTDQQATFSINLDGNVGEKSAEDVRALQELRASISQSTDQIRAASAAMRSLRGSSDEVKSAREQLKAMIDSERNSVSSANLALLKQGTTFEKLTQDAKKYETEQRKLQDKLKAKDIEEARNKTAALGNAVKLAGGPVEELKGRFEALKGVLGGGGAALAGVTLAIAGAIAAVAALTAGAVALGVSFVRWITIGADAARNMNILRLATTRTEENARNLGTQVDALAAKLSTPKEELNTLAASLGRTRLSGQAIVDTFQLVGRASDAMGNDVGDTLKEIVTRGQMWNRFQLNPLELQGKGINFQDVAGELSKGLKIGIGEAQQRLYQGQVTIDQGAKALRAAVEKNFSKINDAKLLSIDSQTRKLHEDLAGLTSGVNIEPLLRGFAELRSLFSQSSVMGQSLKAAITTIGDTFGPTFEKAIPTLKAFFKGAVIGALDVGIAFLRLRNGTRDLFEGAFKNFDAVKAAEFPFKALANAIELTRVAIRGLDLAYRVFKGGIGGGVDVDKVRRDLFEMGAGAPKGLAEGIAAGTPQVGAATNELARTAESGLANKLEIHSPSRVFADYGVDTAEGYELGVRRGSGGAQDAVQELGSAGPRAASSGAPSAAPATGAGAAAAGGGGGGGLMIKVERGAIVIQTQGADGRAVAKELTSASFLAQFTTCLQGVLKGAGIPSQAVPAP